MANWHISDSFVKGETALSRGRKVVSKYGIDKYARKYGGFSNIRTKSCNAYQNNLPTLFRVPWHSKLKRKSRKVNFVSKYENRCHDHLRSPL